MRLIGYIRVSRVAGREGDSFISPDAQKERIMALAAAHGHTLVGWQTDLDQSGARLDRPAFQEALAQVERGEADGIAVAKLDRFARSVSGAGRAMERLEACGGTLLVGDLGMDTSTPAGKLMRNVLMALAEFDLDRIRENWRTASRMAVRRGVHVSGVPPFGYQRRGDGGLEPDPATAPLVHETFVRRAAGESWQSLCEMLDERAPRVRPWRPSTVASMVGRRTYLGEAWAGETVNVGAHDPLVTRAEWEAAQSRQPRAPRSGHESLLTGIVRCAACGTLMTPGSDGRRGYRRYDCQNRVCRARSAISARRLDEHVEQIVLDAAGAARPVRGRPNTRPLRAALTVLEQAETELGAYRDSQLVSVIGQTAFAAGLTERATRVAEARETVAGLQRLAPLRQLDSRLVSRWPSMSVVARREILRAALERVEVRRAHSRGKGTPVGDRVRVVWRGSARV